MEVIRSAFANGLAATIARHSASVSSATGTAKPASFVMRASRSAASFAGAFDGCVSTTLPLWMYVATSVAPALARSWRSAIRT